MATAGIVLLVLHAGCAAVAACHALLTKPDPHSAFGWIVVCWLFPLAGPLPYAVFGINRVRARAKQLRGGLQEYPHTPLEQGHARRKCLPYTLDLARRQSWARRIRNSLVWLLSPYL